MSSEQTPPTPKTIRMRVRHPDAPETEAFEEIPVDEVQGQWALHLTRDSRPGPALGPCQGGVEAGEWPHLFGHPGFSVSHVPTGVALASHLDGGAATWLLAEVNRIRPSGAVTTRRGGRPQLRMDLALAVLDAVGRSRAEVERWKRNLAQLAAQVAAANGQQKESTDVDV